jgi:hypothetical protein
MDKILPKEDIPFGVVGWLELQIAKYPKNTKQAAANIGSNICIKPPSFSRLK